MKKIFTIIAINFAVLCTLIVSLEILSQLVYLMKNGSFILMENTNKDLSPYRKIFEIHPYLAGRLKASVIEKKVNKTITTTNYHTRWTGAEQDDHNLIRIAILGGSTSFGTGVTDEDSWPALLQAKLGKQFAVINYGIPGYSSAEAIIQMALIVPEKRPHIVIFYEGWNDIRNYHEKDIGSDYYGHGLRQYGDLDIPVFEQQNKFQSLRNTFATAWLGDKIKKKMTNPQPAKLEAFEWPDPFVDRIYVRNLHTLKLLAKDIGAFSVFIPQVLNYSSYDGKEDSRLWTRHIKDKAMPVLMDRFNSYMEEVCSQQNKDCIVLSKVVSANWLPEDFVDDGHFSRNGGLKFVEIIAQLIHREVVTRYGSAFPVNID